MAAIVLIAWPHAASARRKLAQHAKVLVRLQLPRYLGDMFF
jgi:hypothetical protein